MINHGRVSIYVSFENKPLLNKIKTMAKESNQPYSRLFFDIIKKYLKENGKLEEEKFDDRKSSQ